MTRKDHELIAGAVRDMEVTTITKTMIAKTLARALASTNARFDATRFTDACVWTTERSRS